MNQLKIRPMMIFDIDGVWEVECQTFSTPWSRGAFEAEIEENDLSYYLVVADKGKIVGYGGMWIIIDEAHVTNIALTADYRGLGLGERLVRALMDKARERGVDSMTLEVRPSNTIAQALYAKLGFLTKGIRKQYYSDNQEDALIMWCDFTATAKK